MKLYRHKVQYYETDQMGIVHHSNYIRWFEEARMALLEQTGMPYQKMEELGIFSPVLSVEADYLRMIQYGTSVLIRTTVEEYNGIKLAVSYQVMDKSTGMVHCKGVTRHCFLNEKGRPIYLKKNYPEIHKMFEKELARGKRRKEKGRNIKSNKTES